MAKAFSITNNGLFPNDGNTFRVFDTDGKEIWAGDREEFCKLVRSGAYSMIAEAAKYSIKLNADGTASSFVCTTDETSDTAADELANVKFDTCPFCDHEPIAKVMRAHYMARDQSSWFTVRCVHASCNVKPVAYAKTVGELAIKWNARPGKFNPPLPSTLDEIEASGKYTSDEITGEPSPDASMIDKIRQAINRDDEAKGAPYSEDFYRKVLAVILDAQARGALRF